VIEHAFGRLKRRFSILSTGIRVNYKQAPIVIVCCAMLHNLAVKKRQIDFGFDDNAEDDSNVIDVEPDMNGFHYRQLVAHSFD